MKYSGAKHDSIPITICLPSVILSIQEKISANNCNACGNDSQQQHDQKHESINVINFVGPKRCENKIPENRKYYVMYKKHLNYNFVRN